MMIWIIFIISLIVSAGITNWAQQMYMRMIGASGMYYNGKTKLIAIVVIAVILCAIIMNIFGIEVPK